MFRIFLIYFKVVRLNMTLGLNIFLLFSEFLIFLSRDLKT